MLRTKVTIVYQGSLKLCLNFALKGVENNFGLTVDHKKLTYSIWQMINVKLPNLAPKQIFYLTWLEISLAPFILLKFSILKTSEEAICQ